MITKQHGSARRFGFAWLAAALLALWLAGCGTTPAVVDVLIDQGDIEVAVGDFAALTATLIVSGGAPTGVTWSSSDPTVATVDPAAGQVNAIAPGTATITATSDFDDSKSASIQVTVSAAAAVASVTIDGGDVELVGVGDTETLTATVVASGGASTDVTWASDTPAVATVDGTSGLVTAVAPGTADITATSTDEPSRSDTITVTVIASAAPVIASFDAVVARGSQLDLSWSATNASTYDVLAVIDGGGTETLASGLAGSSTTVAIPASDRQTLRLVATGPDGEDTAEVTPANVVTSLADYDPYDLLGFTPEAVIPGTLRAVIANAPSGSVVGFASDVTSIVVDGVDLESVPGLAAADAHLIFRDDITVSGPAGGVTISGDSNCPDCTTDAENFVWRSRLMLVVPDTTVLLENLTLSGGQFIFFGAGIQNFGTLTLESVEVSGNRSLGSGGGIHNQSTGVLTINDSQIVDNRSVTLESEVDATFEIRNDPAGSVTFPGTNGSGGAIYNVAGGTVTITDSVIDGNEARVSGGGIYNEPTGQVSLDGTPVTNNTADHNVYNAADGSQFSYGGGIYNGGTLTLADGSLTDNTAASQGGGLYHDVDATSTLTNVLVQQNLAGTSGEPGFGGGIMHQFFTGESTLSLTSVSYGTGNTPQDLLANDRGPRPLGLRLGPAALPDGVNPDDRNQ